MYEDSTTLPDRIKFISIQYHLNGIIRCYATDQINDPDETD